MAWSSATCAAWPRTAANISDEELFREGPFCDVVEGKERYVAAP